MCCPSLPVTETYILAMGNLVLAHLNSQTSDGSNRTIQTESPIAGSKVGSFVEVKGSVSVAPFENTLGYRLYDEANSQIDGGSIHGHRKFNRCGRHLRCHDRSIQSSFRQHIPFGITRYQCSGWRVRSRWIQSNF